MGNDKERGGTGVSSAIFVEELGLDELMAEAVRGLEEMNYFTTNSSFGSVRKPDAADAKLFHAAVVVIESISLPILRKCSE